MAELTGWKGKLGTAGSIFLGGLLLVAAWSKAVDPLVFAQEIRNEGLDFFFSATVVMLIALALEGLLGTALLLNLRRLWVLVPTSLLVAFFLFLTGRNYYLVLLGERDPSRSCGCFGALWNRTAAEAFWQDLFLLVPALVLAFWGREKTTRSFPEMRIWAVLFSTAALLLYTVLVPGLPLEMPGPRLPAEVGFQLQEEYALWVDGQESQGGRVYHSESRLQFLLLSQDLPFPLLLDLRSGEVRKVSSREIQEGDSFLHLSGEHRREVVGRYEVGTEGVSFQAAGRQIRMTPRASPPP